VSTIAEQKGFTIFEVEAKMPSLSLEGTTVIDLIIPFPKITSPEIIVRIKPT
jgi:hypothetical protein